MSLTALQMADLGTKFAADGYLHLRDVVPVGPLEQLRQRLLAAYERASRAGVLFTGGGTISGHLNCFPGAGARYFLRSTRSRNSFPALK